MFLACSWCEVQKSEQRDLAAYTFCRMRSQKWHIYRSRKNKLEDLFTLELKDLKKFSKILGDKNIVWINSNIFFYRYSCVDGCGNDWPCVLLAV